MERLFDILRRTDGRPYPRFRDIQGTYDGGTYTLHIDRVQGSPGSDPTDVRVTVSSRTAGFPEDVMTERRRTALGDLIARRFWESSRVHSKSICFPRPGQEILDRGSVRVHGTHIEIRFGIHLPAAGRNAAGRDAAETFRRLGDVVGESLSFSSYRRSKLYGHIETAENAGHVRSVLRDMGLVSFIADGSVLPRREDGLAPMTGAGGTACAEPVTVEVPNGDPWKGMGIKEGFTVILGVTGSGRSSLADAVMSGVYDHIPGDGRERVVTVPDAVRISGRRPAPGGDGELSGPYAESETIAESAEAGCRLLILDEDRVSNQTLGRDGIARSLLRGEPFVPVTDMIRGLKDNGISVIAVSGRDTVIDAADNLIVLDRGKASQREGNGRIPSDAGFPMPVPRYPLVSGKDLRVNDTSDVFASRDVCYPGSVAASVTAVSGRMDGSVDVRDLSRTERTPGPGEVAVRPVETAMAVLRCGGLTMVRRT